MSGMDARFRFFVITIFAVFFTAFFAASSAQATVGQGASSVQSDMAQLKGTNYKVTTNSVYTTYSFFAYGDTIKEYANNDGVIFAMRWHGVSQPPIKDILGTYFNSYAAASAARAHLHMRRPIMIKTPTIHVFRGGHMRDWLGTAFVQSLAPSGITAGDLR